MKNLLTLTLPFALVVACGSGSPAPPSSPAPAASGAGACGVRLFRSPDCQSALDASCCAVETQCARDPGCAKFAACAYDCKLRGGPEVAESCAQGCLSGSRAEHCGAVCRGQAQDCSDRCLRDGAPGEPYQRWREIASCSKGMSTPPGLTCNDRT